MKCVIISWVFEGKFAINGVNKQYNESTAHIRAHAHLVHFAEISFWSCLHDISVPTMRFHFCHFDRSEIRGAMSFITGCSCKHYKTFLSKANHQNFISPRNELSCKRRLMLCKSEKIRKQRI